MRNKSVIFELFSECVKAIDTHKLIHRESKQDKEFHFQNWVDSRFASIGVNYELGGRNSYPDFRIVHFAEGFEVKGLAYPGREANYDSNSQVPTGSHNGRTIYYIFGRYPSEPDSDSYPVLDLVLCHGDFLNADHDYVHKNKSVKGFGSYGDIMIRDRKMYVAPTPFGLTSGVAHNQTLILPSSYKTSSSLKCIGTLIRKEAANLIVGYKFDLHTNVLIPELVPNPSSAKEHTFYAWRLKSGSDEPVNMRTSIAPLVEVEDSDE